MKTDKSLQRKIQIQNAHAWDLEQDIPWNLGIDVGKDLLPAIGGKHIVPDCTEDEGIVFSQALGLVTAAAIAEHEKILVEMKKNFYYDIIKRYDVCDDFKTLGEMFFQDESKHSQVFNRYIDLYAGQLNVTPEELRSILPIHERKSIFSFLFKLNSIMGGMAFWWTVFTTEEHSMAIYRMIRPMKDKIDPLYFTIHKLHFEEEVRHASFAQSMINLYRREDSSLLEKVLKKMDFVIADVIEKLWMIAQYKRFTKVSKFKERHPFFQTLTGIIEKINQLPFHKKIGLLRDNNDYFSLVVRPEQHKTIVEEIHKSKAFVVSFPKR